MAAELQQMKACLNGRRRPGEHPGLPVTPAELGRSAAAAVAAGAEAVHLHPRGADGRESLLAADVGAAVTAVREACPGVPVGVTTGLWAAGGDPGARETAVAGWQALPRPARPDFASVNVSEAGSADLPGLLINLGIEAEAGVRTASDAALLVAVGPGTAWLRILVEIPGLPAADAVAAADAVLRRLDDLGAAGPRLLHGEQDSCWPLIVYAGRLGLPARIGLEDVLAGPDGAPVSGNADLVRLALEIWAGGPGSAAS